EADIRGLAADERRQARQRRTKPLVDDLRLWFEAQLAAVSGKSTIAGAIRYALSRWEGLTRFLDDGRIEIDSNVVERGLAEFERELILARTSDGRTRAKARGVKFGRPPALTVHQRQEALQRLKEGATQ